MIKRNTFFQSKNSIKTSKITKANKNYHQLQESQEPPDLLKVTKQ